MFESGTLIFIILFGLVVLIPFASIGYIFLWLWKKGRLWKIVGLAIVGFVSYLVYDSIYPSDSFYENEFKRISGMNFPHSGVIAQKFSTFPDIHGDYASCAIIELSAEDYNLFKQKLMSEAKQKKVPISTICGPVGVKREQSALELNIDDGEKGEYSSWGVMEDTPMLFFSFWSS